MPTVFGRLDNKKSNIAHKTEYLLNNERKGSAVQTEYKDEKSPAWWIQHALRGRKFKSRTVNAFPCIFSKQTWSLRWKIMLSCFR